MKISNICNPYTSFGANIDGNYYLRNGVRNVVENGSFEDKNRLLNLLSVIKDDTSGETFKMDKEILSFDNKMVRYLFSIDDNVLFTSPAFINPSAFRDEGDKLFLQELDLFVKSNYSQKVYKEATEKTPDFMKKYLDVADKTDKQFRKSLRKTLNLAPEHYIMTPRGKKIPCDLSNNPIDSLNYVC